MTSPIISACQKRGCQRFWQARVVDGEVKYLCEAFPQGIPGDIVLGSNLHLSPVEGDDGLLFLPPAKNE